MMQGRIEELLASARAAQPEVAIDEVALAGHLGAYLAESDDPAAELETLYVPDLRLAFGCARGVAAALTLLERDYLGPARSALARMLSPSEAEDAIQSLRERVLVGRDGSPPRITEYEGRGSLASWLKVIAVRIGMRVREQRKDLGSQDEYALFDLPAVLAADIEPLRDRYSAAFKRAFHAALSALPPRERTLLRLQFIDELTVDQVGVLYRVHRATAARWLVAARQSLLEQTRMHLAAELGLCSDQLSSILEIVINHVDLSLLDAFDKSEACVIGTGRPV
jgi:RNA polymerase sigma-70 factor (ECF subfamily)